MAQYTIDNRPHGVSRREWIKAREAEGVDPYAGSSGGSSSKKKKKKSSDKGYKEQ
jgi:hypothetical protein